MPFDIMDQRNTLVSSRYFEDIGFPVETQVGFWKPNTMLDNQDKVVGSSPLKKLSVVNMELLPSGLVRDQKQLGIGWKGITNLSEPSWNPTNHHLKSPSNLYMQPAVIFNRNNARVNMIPQESSQFSSSFSEISSRKLKSLGNDQSFQLAGKATTHHEEEPFKSMEEIEAQTIGNILPDEDDLFSGVNDELGLNSHASKGNELEDFDLFSSGGGIELGGDNHVSMGTRNADDNHVSMGTRNSDVLGVFNGQEGSHGITSNSSSTITDMANCAGPTMTEGLDDRHIRGTSSNGHLMEPNARVFLSSGNGSLPPNGHHYLWNNSNSRQQHASSVMVWPNSPSFVNSFHGSHLPQMPAFSRAPPVMLHVGSPLTYHIGSAPPVNSAFWDKRHPYAGESPETSGFHLGSLGSVGFTGSSPTHPVEIASHNFFSHVGGNCMNLMKNGGVHSPQQMCHGIPGRNPMISVPASLDSPNARVRNFSRRRNESNSTNADKKQYELDIDRIILGDENRTTLMIKNIPNKYTSKMLLAAIDEHCRGTYDFIYLPIDFKNKCNVGYAFINMTDPQKIIPLYKAFNGKKWEKFNSEKVATLTFGRIQGKAALIAHFQNSSLMNEDKRCRPILFHTSGPNAGDQEPFPIGTNIRSRPGRPRTTNNEENRHQYSSSTLANGDIFSNGADS